MIPQLEEALWPFLVQLNGERPNVTYDANNRPVDGPPTPFTTVGALQPMSANELQMMPEGEYGEETLVYYSKDSLQPGGLSTELKPDNILFNGDTYKVVSKENWSLHGYFKYLLRKKDSEAN